MNKVVFSSQTCHWRTPEAVYADLHAEFDFNDDPCRLKEPIDGLSREWGTRTFLNPPYGRETAKWIRMAYEQSRQGRLVVCLIASRTCTEWWHEYVMKADEVRFIKGRLRFSGATINAPFPSVVVVFRGSHEA